MLVLTRRVEEQLLIGDSIRVTVLAVDGERVKLGITAPREIAVVRAELVDDVAGSAYDGRAPAEKPIPPADATPLVGRLHVDAGALACSTAIGCAV
jgi:carbon storage regulator